MVSDRRNWLLVRGAHSTQKMRPHARQWCRRRRNVKGVLHLKQSRTASSGIQIESSKIVLVGIFAVSAKAADAVQSKDESRPSLAVVEKLVSVKS
jgi:hypothetical protein